MVSNSFGREISCSQWEGSECTHDGPCFFLLGVGVELRGVIFWFFFLAPNVFPTCSQLVPLRFPKLFLEAFPIAPQFYPIWFAQSSTLRYTNWKGWQKVNTIESFLQLRVQRGASIGKCSMFQKKIVTGPMNMALSKKKKKKLWAHPWTN